MPLVLRRLAESLNSRNLIAWHKFQDPTLWLKFLKLILEEFDISCCNEECFDLELCYWLQSDWIKVIDAIVDKVDWFEIGISIMQKFVSFCFTEKNLSLNSCQKLVSLTSFALSSWRWQKRRVLPRQWQVLSQKHVSLLSKTCQSLVKNLSRHAWQRWPF